MGAVVGVDLCAGTCGGIMARRVRGLVEEMLAHDDDEILLVLPLPLGGGNCGCGVGFFPSSLRIRARYLDLAFSKAVISAALACFRSFTSSSLWT